MAKHKTFGGDPSSLLSMVGNELRRGKIVVLPTEAMHGFSCDYRLEATVGILSRLKMRKPGKGYVLLASDFSQVEHVAFVSEGLRGFLNEFWPGPLTVILTGKNIPSWISPDGGIAVRITSHVLLSRLVCDYGSPLISTSLNFSGGKPLSNIFEIENYFKGVSQWDDVSLVCIDPDISNGRPSTIVDLRGGRPRMVREGPVEIARLERVYEESGL